MITMINAKHQLGWGRAHLGAQRPMRNYLRIHVVEIVCADDCTTGRFYLLAVENLRMRNRVSFHRLAYRVERDIKRIHIILRSIESMGYL